MFKAKSFLFKCYHIAPEVLLTWIYYWKNPALPPRSAHSSNVDRVEEVTGVSLPDQLFFLSINPKYDGQLKTSNCFVPVDLTEATLCAVNELLMYVM